MHGSGGYSSKLNCQNVACWGNAPPAVPPSAPRTDNFARTRDLFYSHPGFARDTIVCSRTMNASISREVVRVACLGAILSIIYVQWPAVLVRKQGMSVEDVESFAAAFPTAWTGVCAAGCVLCA